MWATVRDESLVIQQHLAMIVLGQNLQGNEQWKNKCVMVVIFCLVQKLTFSTG